MQKIVIGKSGTKSVSLDLDVLIRSRALVTANSGGGKSFLLRRMAEQLFGKVPVWIIDPEGEMVTLREKFGFVLVGKGGETPADPRTAPIVAEKLRQLGASAIFDLYDLKPPTRHHWVRVFVEALMNQPKSLWKRLVLMIDECHLFAPEKGQGESEAFSAVQDVATRGRKRRICTIAYTQRLAKISKNVTAELLNRMVGMTREGIDIDSAVNVLSVAKEDREEFRVEIKKREPGEFYALGPAISNDRVLLRVGPVATTHPEIGDDEVPEPPPPPSAVKALLPKLSDLPKEAEEKAKTVEGLRKELISVKAELAHARKVKPAAAPLPAPKPPSPPREVPVLKASQLSQLENALKRLEALSVKSHDLAYSLGTSQLEIRQDLKKIVDASKAPRLVSAAPATVSRFVGATKKIKIERTLPVQETPAPRVFLEGEESIPPAAARILRTLLTFEGFGLEQVLRSWVAGWLGVSYTSGGFRNMLGLLRTAGLVTYPSQDMLLLTEEGRKCAPEVQVAADPDEILKHYGSVLSGQPGKIFSVLTKAYPQAHSRPDVAEALNVVSTSGGFRNSLGSLRTAGLVTYPDTDQVRASDWLFLEVGEGASR